jgi:hypothetical protein
VYYSHLLKHRLSNESQGICATASLSLAIVGVSLIKFQAYVDIEQGESSLFLTLSFLDTLFSFWRRLFS